MAVQVITRSRRFTYWVIFTDRDHLKDENTLEIAYRTAICSTRNLSNKHIYPRNDKIFTLNYNKSSHCPSVLYTIPSVLYHRCTGSKFSDVMSLFPCDCASRLLFPWPYPSGPVLPSISGCPSRRRWCRSWRVVRPTYRRQSCKWSLIWTGWHCSAPCQAETPPARGSPLYWCASIDSSPRWCRICRHSSLKESQLVDYCLFFPHKPLIKLT